MARSWFSALTLGAAGAACAACTLLTDLSGLTGDAPSLVVKRDARDAADGRDALAIPGATDAETDSRSDAGSAYAELMLSDEPLGYFRLNEASGERAEDATGHGNTGLLGQGHEFGVLGAIAGDPDTALRFNGSLSGIDLGRSFDFVGTQPYTLELWAKIVRTDSEYRHLFKKSKGNVSRNAYGVYVQSGTLVFERIVNGTYTKVQAPAAPFLGRWAHIASTFDGSFIRLYIDGVEAARLPDTRAASPIDATCYIGCSDGFDSNVLDGDIDEVAFYDKALTPAQIMRHSEAGLAK